MSTYSFIQDISFTHDSDVFTIKGQPRKDIDPIDSSIEKWQAIVDFLEKKPASRVLNSGKTCALCEKYIDKFECNGCPIANITGYRHCLGTPWSYNINLSRAKKELEFLTMIKNEIPKQDILKWLVENDFYDETILDTDCRIE